MSSALKLFDVSMIKCVNEAFSRPITRVRSSGVMSRASSNCTGRGSRYRPESCLVSDRLSSVRSSRDDVLGDVGQRVFGNRVEEHVGVAEAQVEVEQDDGVVFVGGQRAAQVDGQARRADAAGRAGDGDHRAAAAACPAGCRAAAARRAAARRRGLPA